MSLGDFPGLKPDAMRNWIPAEQPTEGFFGVDRAVPGSDLTVLAGIRSGRVLRTVILEGVQVVDPAYWRSPEYATSVLEFFEQLRRPWYVRAWRWVKSRFR